MAPTKQKKVVHPLGRFITTLIVILIAFFLLSAFVAQIYYIPTGSMENTLLVGDCVLLNKLAYRLGKPQPGEVIALKYPLNPSKTIIKRCLATEGQTVEIVDKVVYIDGNTFREPVGAKFTDKFIKPAIYSRRDNFGPQQVPMDALFVLGDNRDNSEDSRDFGFVDKNGLKGKISIILFSWKPDPNAPKLRSPYILPLIEIFFYNLYHLPDRVRWDRILSRV